VHSSSDARASGARSATNPRAHDRSGPARRFGSPAIAARLAPLLPSRPPRPGEVSLQPSPSRATSQTPIHNRTPIVAQAASRACRSATVAHVVYARFSHSRGLSVHPRVPRRRQRSDRRLRFPTSPDCAQCCFVATSHEQLSALTVRSERTRLASTRSTGRTPSQPHWRCRWLAGCSSPGATKACPVPGACSFYAPSKHLMG
jgi:hypothetical protein